MERKYRAIVSDSKTIFHFCRIFTENVCDDIEKESEGDDTTALEMENVCPNEKFQLICYVN